MRRLLILSALVISAVAITLPVLAGAGGGGCHRDFTDTATNTVDVVDNCFLSDVARIDAGDTVTWTNSDSYAHNIFSRTFAGAPNLSWANTYSYTFDTAGVFPYSCTLHPGMIGVVIVGDVAPSTAVIAEVPPAVVVVTEAPVEARIDVPVVPIAESDDRQMSWLISAGLLTGGLALGATVNRLRNRTDPEVAG